MAEVLHKNKIVVNHVEQSLLALKKRRKTLYGLNRDRKNSKNSASESSK